MAEGISMNRNFARGFGAVTVGAALGAVGISGISMPVAAAEATQMAGVQAGRVSHSSPASGTQLWIQRYVGAGVTDNFASAVVVSPGGGSVFVTGTTTRAGATTTEEAQLSVP